ncbi:MAG: hypothetical protein AAGC77_09320 [Pseudomonadota bacterium]
MQYGRYKSLLSLLALSWVTICSTASAQTIGVFQFDDWPGPEITVHFVEPDDVPAEAPIVFVMHGVLRNAQDYRDNWVQLAKTHGFRVFAPEFDAKRFPRSKMYNLGGVGVDGPSAFDAIEPLFHDIRHRANTNQNTYYLFGHSAGAQFVHRFLMLRPDARLSLAVAANAGWYTLPRDDIKWPYGLGGLDDQQLTINAAFRAPLVVMLGEDDNDPNDANLRKTKEANAQGAHRFARGLNFMRIATEVAEASDITLRWKTIIVRNAGHDNAVMAKAAATVIGEHANNGTKTN